MTESSGPTEPPRDPQWAAPAPGWSAQQPPPTSGWATPHSPPAAWTGASPTLPTGPAPGWGWAPTPAPVKPGVVPLRPLSVGEILDGAITTMRENPRAMLLLSALVVACSQVLQVLAMWLLLRDVDQLTVTDPGAPADQVLADAVDNLIGLGVAGVISWLVTILLSGVLTVVVSQAVLGRKVTPGQAWQRARPRLLALIGLTLLVALVVTGPFLAVGVLGLLFLAAGAETAAILCWVLGGLAAVVAALFLYVRFSLAMPALMLESRDGVHTGVVQALRRSSRLVASSWWRVFGILLLAIVITALIGQVVGIPFAILGGLDADTTSLGALSLQGVGAIIATTITAPFSAAVTVLLYVDQRMRREGLDIELTRAAATDAPQPPEPPA